jgi:hypothetical protein
MERSAAPADGESRAADRRVCGRGDRARAQGSDRDVPELRAHGERRHYFSAKTALQMLTVRLDGLDGSDAMIAGRRDRWLRQVGALALTGLVVLFATALGPIGFAHGMEDKTELVSAFELRVLDSEDVQVPHYAMDIKSMIAKYWISILDQPHCFWRESTEDIFANGLISEQNGMFEFWNALHFDWVAQLCRVQEIGSDLDDRIEPNFIRRCLARVIYPNLNLRLAIAPNERAVADVEIGAQLPYRGISSKGQLLFCCVPLLASEIGGERRGHENEYKQKKVSPIKRVLFLALAATAGAAGLWIGMFVAPRSGFRYALLGAVLVVGGWLAIVFHERILSERAAGFFDVSGASAPYYGLPENIGPLPLIVADRRARQHGHLAAAGRC